MAIYNHPLQRRPWRPGLASGLGLSCSGVGTIRRKDQCGNTFRQVRKNVHPMACLGFEALGIFGLLAASGVWTLYAAMFLIGVGYGGSVVC